MQSFLSRLMPAVMVLRGAKKRYASAELTLAKIEKLRLNPAPRTPPRGLERTVRVEERSVDGWPVYDLLPPSGSPSRRILYLHGGSYVYEISPQHWTLSAELAVRTDARVSIPLYPLAPTGTALGIVGTAADLAAAMIHESGAANVTVAGDSAGGSMALAVAMELRDRGVDAPRVILISPVLDSSFTDPAVAAIVPRDPWLDLPGAKVSGELYRGELPITDWRVSPINGSLAGVGPIQQFSGTRDMLNADAHRLVALAATAGVPLEYHEVAEMIHVYPLLPIPEARVARTRMVDFITR